MTAPHRAASIPPSSARRSKAFAQQAPHGSTSTPRRVRRILSAAAAILALSALTALAFGGCQGSGVGDPCVPEEEYLENFAGFKLSEENIESRSFQCNTRICLVNHFQGRVSCPEGQAPPIVCDPANGDTDCAADEGTTCTKAGETANTCDPTACGTPGTSDGNCNREDGTNDACDGGVCNPEGGYCECDPEACSDGSCCLENQICDPQTRLCTAYVCSKPRSQAEGEQRCYLPGSDVPVAVPVCGQCAATSMRTAEDAVYCSCRCGVADGQPDEPNFNFCECPEGFSCEEIRPHIGLGDKQLSGKYCIRQGTGYIDEGSCGAVQGWWGPQCDGSDVTL